MDIVKKKRQRPCPAPFFTTSSNSIAIGHSATTIGSNSIAIGHSANASGGNVVISAGCGSGSGSGGTVTILGGGSSTFSPAPFTTEFWHTLFIYLQGGSYYSQYPGINISCNSPYTENTSLGMGLAKNYITQAGIDYLQEIKEKIEEIWVPAADFRVLLDLIRQPCGINLQANIAETQNFRHLLYSAWNFLKIVEKKDDQIILTEIGQEAFLDVIPDLLEAPILKAFDEKRYHDQLLAMIPFYEWARLLSTLPAETANFWAQKLKLNSRAH